MKWRWKAQVFSLQNSSNAQSNTSGPVVTCTFVTLPNNNVTLRDRHWVHIRYPEWFQKCTFSAATLVIQTNICQEEADLLSQWTSRWMAKMISLLTKTKPSEQHYLWCHCVTPPSSLLKKAVPSICFMHPNIHTTCQNFVPTRDYRDEWQFAKMLNESFKILQQSSFLFCFVLLPFCLFCLLFVFDWMIQKKTQQDVRHAWTQTWNSMKSNLNRSRRAVCS